MIGGGILWYISRLLWSSSFFVALCSVDLISYPNPLNDLWCDGLERSFGENEERAAAEVEGERCGAASEGTAGGGCFMGISAAAADIAGAGVCSRLISDGALPSVFSCRSCTTSKV